MSNIKVKNIIKHFNKICKHKVWVGYYCFKAGIPMRGITHDLSKFSPAEFWESVKYYQGTSSPIEACKKDKGYSAAWLHHKGKNKHHYEYWQDNFDNGGTSLIMPYKDAVEMLCDYIGATRAYMGDEFSFKKEWDWWVAKNKRPLAMTKTNKDFMTLCLFHMKQTKKFVPKDFIKTYYAASVEQNKNNKGE